MTTGGTLDVTSVEEVAEGALNLECAEFGEMVVDSGNRYGFGGLGDE